MERLGYYRTIDVLTLNINEELSFSDKLHDILKWENGKRNWLLNINKRLGFLEKQVTKLASDYVLGNVEKTTFGPLHYIYVTGSGNVNHLMEQTEQHIVKLEQFLAEQGINTTGKPFTIYNSSSLSGDVIFSTALPIDRLIEINVGNPIRYGFKELTEVYSLKVRGNPRNIGLLWKNFEQTKELTLATMSSNKYLLHNSSAYFDDIKDKEQQLIWEIEMKKEKIQLDTIKNVTKIEKDSLFQSL